MKDEYPMRIQKYLARCGAGSRRACDGMVEQGRVSLNGDTVEEAGTMVEGSDIVTLDGKVMTPLRKRYFLLDKPGGYISVNRDPEGRKWVVDLIEGGREMGLFPVGRLDLDTTGLMILTNDGDIANRISHPRFKVRKHYLALIKGEWELSTLKDRIEGALELRNGGVVRDSRVHSAGMADGVTHVELSIHEGRKHVVKRIFLTIGSRVKDLRRLAIGNLSVDVLEGRVHMEVERSLLEDRVL